MAGPWPVPLSLQHELNGGQGGEAQQDQERQLSLEVAASLQVSPGHAR